MSEQGYPADRIDTTKPHPARMYDYFLGGRDNYEVDREAAERVVATMPRVPDAARANRAFMLRAVRTLVAECGIRQIIDIGTGIPTSPNTHEAAQAIAPETTVVYVDNDPIVDVHARARLTGVGRTAFVLADVRRPEEILAHPYIKAAIDFDLPIGLLLVAVLHFITDREDPWRIVATLRDALPPGSCLVLSHNTSENLVDDPTDAIAVYRSATATMNLRTLSETTRFFEGFDLLKPGIVTATEWRPDAGASDRRRFGVYCGVALKP